MPSFSASLFVSASEFTSTKFDYLVVGGGNAGIPLAVRLSELGNVSVGVLEAGEKIEGDPIVDLPSRMGEALRQETYDWNLKTVPQKHAGNREINTARGRMLGGSSAINYMAYDRASKVEYDQWNKLTDDNHAWDWESLLPYFKKAEDCRSIETTPDHLPSFSAEVDVSSHGPLLTESVGADGPVKLSFGESFTDVVEPFVKAWNSLGVLTLKNAFCGEKHGAFKLLRSIDAELGTRVHSATAYLPLAGGRKNLKILTGARVNKILFRPGAEDLVATGVEFTVGQERLHIDASEVILSAGAFYTPAILEWSGIGNAKLLRAAGIAPLLDLPGVGENMQDHLFTASQFLVHPHVKTQDLFRNDAKFAEEQQKIYDTTKKGWLAMLDNQTAFVPFKQIVDQNLFESTVARLRAKIDAEMHAGNLSAMQQEQYGIQLEWLEKGNVPNVEFWLVSRGLIDPKPGESYFLLVSGQMHPFSRGSVHVTSANPKDTLKIDPNYFENDFDMEVHVACAGMREKLADTEAFKSVIKAWSVPPVTLERPVLEMAIRQGFLTGYHYFGTAAMARREIGGVVGSDLRVHGTRNLRVVDASIVPLPIAAHLQATIYALAEKAADIIKEDARP
ncbi:alcohol oxidase [Vararia minispora EC-137]|uniref:Alcohol oxidase n=1 Tax=Vararia minispora EC-137 TaxID=1314806 RepID=A0ACB8QX50_9AGAM|nr:alcohol oxidase [Vararia minispora EC-137]